MNVWEIEILEFHITNVSPHVHKFNFGLRLYWVIAELVKTKLNRCCQKIKQFYSSKLYRLLNYNFVAVLIGNHEIIELSSS